LSLEPLASKESAVMVQEQDGVEIVVADLAAARDIGAAAAVLSAAERQRARRFASERDRKRFITRRAWLRELLAVRLQLPAASVRLVDGPLGKPALAPNQAGSPIHFNLSHCEDVAVYAFAPTEVGVDVEAIRKVDEADEIAAAAFSRVENDAYRALGGYERTLGFLNCWTRKEAFVKATGRGLLASLDSFDVSLAPVEAARILRVGNTSGENCGWRLRGFTPAPGFVAAVVNEEPS
jgi:4'-phosphopantetheinyl transferase